MTEQRQVRNSTILIPVFAGALALVIFAAAGGRAQGQSASPPQKGGVTYEDPSSETCEQQNQNNPYTGMDPLTCKGETAPQASNGACDLQGMQVWKHVGETCIYCYPISSPPNTIIVPMDQVRAASLQGWGCGVDQMDACMAVCNGGHTFTPIAGTVVKGGGPGPPPTPTPKGGGPPRIMRRSRDPRAGLDTCRERIHACRSGRGDMTIARTGLERTCRRDARAHSCRREHKRAEGRMEGRNSH